MDLDLSPKLPKRVYGNSGGSYHAWCPQELPMLRQGNIGAAKLVLKKSGFALPQYSDSSKVAYVLQGTGVAGIVLPESKEKVMEIKEGDTVALPFGVVTWWYNKEDTELVVLFLGDTSKAHKAGQFTDFFLTGSNGIFTGFTTEFVRRAWDLDDDTLKALVGNHKSNGIIKLGGKVKKRKPSKHKIAMALNCSEAALDVEVKEDGRVAVFNRENGQRSVFLNCRRNLPPFWDIDLDDDVEKLDGDSNVNMPEPKKEHRDGMAFNCLEAPLDVDIKNGGRVVVLNSKNLPLVGEIGLGADLVRLDGSAMCSPGFSCDSALQVTYVIRGSGHVQIVGADGRRLLETTVKGGDLFIVPRFCVVSKIADPDGLEWFSIITTPNPIFTHLAGRTGAWKALSPEVLQAAFNVPAETQKLFRSKRTSDEIFFPPTHSH